MSLLRKLIRIAELQKLQEHSGKASRFCPSHRERGVSLIEMLIVLVIIGVIAAMIVPTVIGRPDEARVTVATTDIKSIGNALEIYRLDSQRYPTTEQGLKALVVKPVTPPEPRRWQSEGYLRQVPTDPWGNPYVYRAPGEHSAFDLLSYGADGKPGGDGINADLTNDGRSK